MKKRILGNPLWLSLVMTAVLTWVQILVARDLNLLSANRQFAVYLSVAVLAVFFLLIALYTASGRRGGLLFWGETSLPLGFTGVAAGACLLLTYGQQAWGYYQTGQPPAPYFSVFGAADKVFLEGTLLFGVIGGAAILVFGILWLFGKKVGSTACQWLSLFPILWAFCRLARYVMSYSSTIRNAYSAAQAALLILSLLFFYMFGQHLNGRLKLSGNKLPACAFAFGMIAISVFVAQWYVRNTLPEQIAGVVVIADVSDLLCGVFALAVGAVACTKKAAEKTEAFLEQSAAEAEAALCGDTDETPATVPLVVADEPKVFAEPTVSVETVVDEEPQTPPPSENEES